MFNPLFELSDTSILAIVEHSSWLFDGLRCLENGGSCKQKRMTGLLPQGGNVLYLRVVKNVGRYL